MPLPIDYINFRKNVKFLSYDDLKSLAQHYKLDTKLLTSEVKIHNIPNTIYNMYQQENKSCYEQYQYTYKFN